MDIFTECSKFANLMKSVQHESNSQFEYHFIISDTVVRSKQETP